MSCDPWDQPPSGSMDTSMRWSPSLSAVLSGGKVCSIQDLFPRRPSSVGRGGALPPADRPQRGGAIPSGGRSVRLGSPRRPSSVGSPPFPGRTWGWWRRYSKPAKAWAARAHVLDALLVVADQEGDFPLWEGFVAPRLCEVSCKARRRNKDRGKGGRRRRRSHADLAEAISRTDQQRAPV